MDAKNSQKNIGHPLSCLLCGDDRGEEIVSYDAPDIYERTAGIAGSGYYRAWIRCAGCGFIYSRYSRDRRALDRLYASAYRTGLPALRGNKTTREIFDAVVQLPPDQSETVQRIAWLKSNIDHIVSKGFCGSTESRKRTMLDVGGATGVFAFLFQDDLWKSEIVDPSDAGCFVTEFGIDYHQCYFDSDFKHPGVDLVAMVFTLEHLVDPIGCLKTAKSILDRGGMLYVEIPDAFAFDYKPPDDDIFNSCHLWMFSPGSLLKILDIAGFQVMALRRTITFRGHYSLCALAINAQ